MQYNTTMIDPKKIEEWRELIPPEQWPLIVHELFDPQSGDVSRLVQAMTDGQDRQAVSAQAHKLKGAAMLLGLLDLGNWAAHIENMALESDAPWTEEAMQRLQSVAAETLADLQATLSG